MIAQNRRTGIIRRRSTNVLLLEPLFLFALLILQVALLSPTVVVSGLLLNNNNNKDMNFVLRRGSSHHNGNNIIFRSLSSSSSLSLTSSSSGGTARGKRQNNRFLAHHHYHTFFLPSSSSASVSTPYHLATHRLFASSSPLIETTESSNSATTTNNSNMSTDDNQKKKYTEYEECVRRLYRTNLFNPVKLGLESTGRLYELIGKPLDDDKMVVMHIAGTNGKGSVALKIAKTLEASNPNLKVGLFCSPHVSSFRERMQVNGDLISEDEVVEYLPQIYDYCEQHDIPATFFEITTTLAFLFYSKRQTDVVVLETGLGGRLDSTNIIAKPALSIITSIGLEHTNILGDTIELIAKEKAGIIKPTCPVLVGPNVPHDVIRQCAQEKQSGQYYTCEDVLGSASNAPDATTTDFVDYDLENNRIATAALKLVQESHSHVIPKLTQEIIQQGTSKRPPCRFEFVQVPLHSLKKNNAEKSQEPNNQTNLNVILDVAHNPPAMEYLVQKLKHTYPQYYAANKFRLIVGMSRDKDMKLCMDYLLDLVKGNTDQLHFVEGFHPRAMKLEDILTHVPPGDGRNCHYDLQDRSITKQLEIAINTAQNDEMIVICGSVFLMAEAREALGFDEPRDSDAISEMAGINFKNTQENFGDDNNKTKETK